MKNYVFSIGTDQWNDTISIDLTDEESDLLEAAMKKPGLHFMYEDPALSGIEDKIHWAYNRECRAAWAEWYKARYNGKEPDERLFDSRIQPFEICLPNAPDRGYFVLFPPAPEDEEEDWTYQREYKDYLMLHTPRQYASRLPYHAKYCGEIYGHRDGHRYNIKDMFKGLNPLDYADGIPDDSFFERFLAENYEPDEKKPSLRRLKLAFAATVATEIYYAS